MFKRNDSPAPAKRRFALPLTAAAALLALMLPGIALSVINTMEPAASAPIAEAKPIATGNYQVRCWQYGRLLFEENHVKLPDTSQYGIRMGGTDRNGRPLYVADTKNATCLIRSAVEERRWPR